VVQGEGTRRGLADITFQQLSSSTGTEANLIITGVTCMMLACKYGHHDIMNTVLKQSDSFNTTDSEGNNILHYTCRSKNADATLAFLRDGQLLSPQLIHAVDANGDTPLHLCCNLKNIAAASILLTYLHSDEGKHYLQQERVGEISIMSQSIAAAAENIVCQSMANIAHKNSSPQISKLFDEHHYQYPIHLFKNTSGKTPLHIAVKRRSIDLVDLLLQYDFCPDARDSSGTSPRDLALKLPKSSPILAKLDYYLEQRKLKTEMELAVQQQRRASAAAVAVATAAVAAATTSEAAAMINKIGRAMPGRISALSFEELVPRALVLSPSMQAFMTIGEEEQEQQQEGQGAALQSTGIITTPSSGALCPMTPIKPTAEKKKSGLLVAPLSRQELFREKRNSKALQKTVEELSTLPLSAVVRSDPMNPETELTEENNEKSEDECHGVLREEKCEIMEPLTEDFSTPVKRDGTILSPEYTSGARLNVAPCYSGSNYKAVTSAPKKQGSAAWSVPSSLRKSSKSTVLQPPPTMLPSSRLTFCDEQ
jgi:ankyrin repeat protein